MSFYAAYVMSVNQLFLHTLYLGVDPYALIMCEGKTVRTPTLQNTRNPEWNSGALFYVRRPKKTHLIVQVGTLQQQGE